MMVKLLVSAGLCVLSSPWTFAAVTENLAAVPLHFEPADRGAVPAAYLVRGKGVTVVVDASGASIARPGFSPVRLKLHGGRVAKLEPLQQLPGVSNYYIGNNRKLWREGVPHYSRVRARGVYEGIDVVYYGNERRVEYDFVVAPNADPSRIALRFEGAKAMSIDAIGDLVISAPGGVIRQHRPVVYQEIDGRRVEVAATYRIENGEAKFELARYDHDRPLVIDPILEYGTFLGGAGHDEADAVALGSDGAIFVAGLTPAAGFGAGDGTYTAYVTFVAKIAPDGSALSYSTFLGGNNQDVMASIAVDGAGKAYVAGSTRSTDFPTKNPIQPALGGTQGLLDGFIAGLSPAGALDFSTYLGGSSIDSLQGISIGASGIVATGGAGSTDFPRAAGLSGGVAVRLSPDGTSLVFSKVLPNLGGFTGVAQDSAGAIYLTGVAYNGITVAPTPGAFQSTNRGLTDVVAAKLTADGSTWTYVTHLGGSNADTSSGIAVDSAGRAHIAGHTLSGDFPLLNAHQSRVAGAEAFLSVLNPSGSGLVFSTVLGGALDEDATGVAVAPNGDVVIAGSTRSPDFPLNSSWTPGIPALHPSEEAAFFAKFSAAGVLKYSSLYGADLAVVRAVAVAPNGAAILAGAVSVGPATSDVVTPGAVDTTPDSSMEAFVARFTDGPTAVNITISSNPAGRPVVVDRRIVTTPATFSWQPGTKHILDANAPQIDGQNFISFAGWSNAGPAVQSLTAPAAPTTYTVSYSVAPCSFAFPQSAAGIGFEGRRSTTSIATQSLCKWAPVSSASWLVVETVTPQLTGPSQFFFSAALNSGPPRTATITVGSAVLTVTQGGSQGTLPAPSILSPAVNQVIQALGMPVSWAPVSGATGYELRVLQAGCCLANLKTVVYFGQQAGANATSASIDMPAGSYEIYVRACVKGAFGDGNCGSFGIVPVSIRLQAPTDNPSIRLPTVLGTSTRMFEWYPVAGASHYAVTLRDESDNIVLQINTPERYTIFTMRSSPRYQLSVQACQLSCGPPGTMSFSVELPPVPSAPATGVRAQFTNGSLLLNWNRVTGADLYRVQIVQPNAGPGGGALTVAAKQVSIETASLRVPPGPAIAFVTACNGNGCGPQSAGLPINSPGPAYSEPVVAVPMPVVVENGPIITISWSRIAGDDGTNTDYRLYVGDLSRNGPALDVVTKNNFYSAYLRAEGRRYDALVFATQNGNTVVGRASGFMVAGTSAPAPLVTAPTHNSTFKQGGFRLAWSPIPGAARYQYYVARQGQSAAVLTGVTPGLYLDTSLNVTADTSFNAIVRACPEVNTSQCSPDSDAGWGPWSNLVTGTTAFTIRP